MPSFDISNSAITATDGKAVKSIILKPMIKINLLKNMFDNYHKSEGGLRLNKSDIALIVLLFITALNMFAQSGKWDLTGTVGTTGFKDHGNGVMQLISTDATGCAGAAVHETSEKYNPAVDGVFNKCYNVYFGCPGDDQIGSDTKGDGLAFSFSKCAYTVGGCGGGLGYAFGCPKMITIEFDTWSSQGTANFDNVYEGTGNNDQVAIHRDGDPSQTGKIVGVDPGNLEDGLEHVVCISYNPATGVMSVSIDGNNTLTHTLAAADRLENYFGAGGLNQTWSSGKNGATNPATVSDDNQADLSDNVGSLCAADVNITSLASGAILSSCTGPVTIEAEAFPPAGNTVDFVEFFVNNVSIGTDNTVGYSKVWNNPALGENLIKAVAHFKPSGTTQTSTIIDVIVGGGIEETVIVPTIDGTAEAVWTSKVAVPLKKAEGGVSAPDLAATYKTMYDATNLYVLVNVVDDNLSNDGGNHWENDGVEIYLDLGNDKSGAYGPNDFQYTFVYNNAPTVIANRPAALTGVVFAQSVTAQGYQMEIRFPWTTLGGVPKANDLIGFDVMVNDDDAGGARDHRLAWHDGTYSSFNNTALFGTQKFISCDPIIATVTSSKNAFCKRDSVKISASPKDASYTYEWFLNNTSIGAPKVADSVFYAKVGGNYKVKVNNGASSNTSANITITENALPLASAGTSSPICAGTSTSLLASGGTTYLWSPSTGLSNVAIANPVASPTATTRYKVTVGNGTCSDTSSVLVTVNPLPTKGTISPIADVCAGSNATLTLSGQTAGTTIQWRVSNDGVAFKDTLTNSASISLTGLAAKTYHFKAIVKSASCEDTTVAVNFTVNPALSITSYNVNPTACKATDGKAVIKGLTNGDTYQVSTNGATAVSLTAVSDSIIVSGLKAGAYSFEVQNAKGCKAITTTSLSDPGSPVVAAGTYPVVCEGTEMTITASNPNGATLTWDNGITDGVAFTINTTTTFTVEAELSGCTASDNVTVTVNPKPAVTSTANVTICAGENVTLVASGATTYSWESGAINDGDVVSPIATTTYGVEGTDGNNCKDSSYTTVTVNDKPAAGVISTIASTTCAQTDVALELTGFTSTGTTIQWQVGRDGTTFQDTLVDASSFALKDLPATTYFFRAIVANGLCSDTSLVANFEVSSALTFPSYGIKPLACGSANGNAVIKGLTNGTVYKVAINGAAPVNRTADGDSIIISGLKAGSYSCSIENPDGCSAITTVSLSDPGAPSVSAGTYPTVCEGSEITLTATNSDGADITWDNGVTDGVAFIINATTTFKVEAKLNGCTSNDFVTILVDAPPTAFAGNDVAFCSGTGGVQLNATGGTAYSWAPATGLSKTDISNPTANPLVTTTYTVIVEKGACVETDEVTVTVNATPQANAGTDATMCADSAGIQLNATGGTTYSWSPAVGLSTTTISNPVATPSTTTNYTVTVSNENCSATDVVIVTVEKCKAPIIIPDVFTPNGDNVNDVWEIPGILSYDNHKVEVFNRWGNRVFESNHYTTPWDGTRGGELLPFGTYYFIITLDKEQQQGSLTIIR